MSVKNIYKMWHKMWAEIYVAKALAWFAYALWSSGSCDYVEVKERIRRLMGWMCERGIEADE